jgi:hypothetical protein
MVELTEGELELEGYLACRGWAFERHPFLSSDQSAPRPDYLVQCPRAPFLCEVKDIDSWRILEHLEKTPDRASYLNPELSYRRPWSRIRDAYDKQLARYASIHPTVVALSEIAASDVVLDSHSMCELLIGENQLVLDRESGQIVRSQASIAGHPYSLFYAENADAKGFTYLTGGLAAVIVVRLGGEGVSVYLNPNCEALRLGPDVFDHPDDQVWGLTANGSAYGPISQRSR